MKNPESIGALKLTLARTIAAFASALLFLWCTTLNRQVRELDKIDAYLEQGRRVQVMFWHGKYLPLFALAKGKNATVFIADSFRGRIIASICRWFGYQPALLPQGQNGTGISFLLEQFKASDQLYAVAIDGPIGPNHKIRHGAVGLAAENGISLVPLGIESSRKIILNARWDKQEIPLPFSKIVLTVGEAIDLPMTALGRDYPALDEKIGNAMNEQHHRAKQLLQPTKSI